MANKHLQLNPHQISDRAWWYEESGGLGIYVEAYTEGDLMRLGIPWRSLRAALKRKDKREA